LKKHYIEDRKFIYLPVILKELEAYTKGRTMSYKDALKQAMEQLNKLPKQVSVQDSKK
jgi:hypothetical protein